MTVPESPVGAHRVLEPAGVLPQAAQRLDTDPALWPGEVRVRVDRLNLDAASAHQLRRAADGDPDAVRQQVLGIVRSRGKMHNPVTGSGGMLLGTVEEVGPQSPLGLRVGQRVATLVSLTLTPLALGDGLERWDGRGEQVPTSGHAILFSRSIAAVVPDDLPEETVLAVMDVCGAPALVDRVVRDRLGRGLRADVAVLGAAGKSGALSLAAARAAGAGRLVGLVPVEEEATRLRASGLADDVVLADATDPLAAAEAVRGALDGHGADVTVVCVDVPGCEHGAVLATDDGGTVVFFSMATSFSAAALGAEGLAADVTMLVGNGYTPGHAELALTLYRDSAGVQQLLGARMGA
ncbi:L-erythro-3,5-diaminohexanoate dehydrogenase [Aquipuribacter nitratireducens]|uniref:L-erythro-3,5-diaminohexanoate dehydrogenase n=1 Tax=Aquipuribacter nitratireducens TaxID=650104 RepID=A0ABW0GK16_9MICO